MAKPKFELTSDLIKVEPEPQPVPQTPVAEVEKSASQTNANVFGHFHQPKSEILHNTPAVTQGTIMHDETVVKPKEERQSMSLFLSKNLKKRFHLHCVQNGLSMTDAIEIAIKNYLEENQ